MGTFVLIYGIMNLRREVICMKNMQIFREPSSQRIHPSLVQKMGEVVNQVVVHPKFRSDFYVHDIREIERCNGIFAWYVYDCGTHFIPLDDPDKVMEFQNEWLSCMKDLKDKKTSEESGRLYVCNIFTGEMKRVHHFEEGNLAERLKAAV
jgi:hypothetical protein